MQIFYVYFLACISGLSQSENQVMGCYPEWQSALLQGFFYLINLILPCRGICFV